MSRMRFHILLAALGLAAGIPALQARDIEEEYEQFRSQMIDEYSSFRDEANKKYADFLRGVWKSYEEKPVIPKPKDEPPLPPVVYSPVDHEPVDIVPVQVVPVEIPPRPLPIEPVRETPVTNQDYLSFDFLGVPCRVRMPKTAPFFMRDSSPKSVADAWERLSKDEMNNAIRDCLEIRLRYKLSDWAYLLFLSELGSRYCNSPDEAALLTAFLFCQSGYQMRLANDNGRLVMLYGSNHYIYNVPYFIIDGKRFYVFGKASSRLNINETAFRGEKPMSLIISEEQLLGPEMSDSRTVVSKKYSDMKASAAVPVNLIDFYNKFPTSCIDNNPITRWAIYANTPMAEKTRQQLYPALRNAVGGCSEEEAVNKILNWVQTGFVYEYDDKVWGEDRAFFAEETIFYPYSDCEDRSILFSRLVRDLLGLDVALVSYPGHMATAVRFNSRVAGDAVIIDGARFVICDPTYINAPVGSQMPSVDCSDIQTIVLNR